MDLLQYDSGSEDNVQEAADGADGEACSTDTHSSDESVDSATLRARAAEARLQDFGAASGRAATGLPEVGSLFSQIDGPPSYLDPEATRQLAASSIHGRNVVQLDEPDALKVKAKAGPGFDIALLAPPLKGQSRPGDNKRNAPPGAIIEGKAKRYKDDDGAGQQYTAAQIAMMGGNIQEYGDDDGGSAGGGGGVAAPRPGAALPPSLVPRVPTKAMGVADFLDKGIGAAQLPRRAQDRKDKEKLKRAAGQSAIGSWKTEAEMVLRQQYDS